MWEDLIAHHFHDLPHSRTTARTTEKTQDTTSYQCCYDCSCAAATTIHATGVATLVVGGRLPIECVAGGEHAARDAGSVIVCIAEALAIPRYRRA